MSVTERLSTLNALRAAKGKPALKSWKESRVKLEEAIEALTPAASLERVKPTTTKDAVAQAPVTKTATKPVTKPVTKNLAKQKRKDDAPVADKTTRAGDFATWCRAEGINPKVARQRLRSSGIKPVNGTYALTDATKTHARGKR